MHVRDAEQDDLEGREGLRDAVEEGREAKRQRCGETGKQQGLRKQVHDINKLDIPTEEKSRRIQVSIVTLTEDAMLN